MTAEREWWCDFFGTGAQERQEVLGVFFGQENRRDRRSGGCVWTGEQ